jgi:hypothetical protein
MRRGYPLIIVALVLAACTQGKAATSVTPSATATPSCYGGRPGGDAVAPAAGVQGGTRWLFSCNKPAVDYTPSSKALADLAAKVPGLGTTGLKSTPDTSAVMLVEDDPNEPWGTELRLAERSILDQFASDPSMGGWLILVTDVVVHASLDPIPPTAYRWTRAEVQQYVDCGIPDSGTNDCSTAFFKTADVIVLAPEGGAPHGR